MKITDNLAQKFAEFPGIGERQAKRFVYFLLRRSKEDREEISRLIKDLSSLVSMCKTCYRYFEGSGDICEDCSDKNRDTSTLMVLEKDADYEGMKKSRVYNGLYFLFGGTIPIVEKNTGTKVRLKELVDRTKNMAKDSSLKEVILAFSYSRDGDHTSFYLKQVLEKELSPFGVKITMLGRGLSTGTEIEYSDTDTLQNALKGRQ